MAPFDENADPVHAAQALIAELRKFNEALYLKPRWLVLNKVDMLPEEQRDQICKAFIQKLEWTDKYFMISALTGEGCRQLTYEIMDYLEQHLPSTYDND